MTSKQEKDVGTNLVLLYQSRNMIFPTPATIQKCLIQIQNILAF